MRDLNMTLRPCNRAIVCWAVVAALLASGCGGSGSPAVSSPAAPASSSQQPVPAAGSPSVAAASTNFQAEWDQLVAAARKEGKLTIALGPNPPFEQQVLPAFQKEFGLDVEEQHGSAADLTTRLIQEKGAGVQTTDVFLTSSTSGPDAYAAGLYAPIKPQLIIPDANDPSKWVGGKISYLDKDENYIVRLDRQIRYFFHIDPQAVDAGKLKTPQDLLAPQWKGKIAALDTTVGSGQSIGGLILKVMGEDYVKQLYVGQNVKFANDQRVLGDWIAKGTYPIGIALPVDEYVSVKNAGLPIVRLKPEGLTASLTSVLLLGTMASAPHPNTAKLFLNWMLTQNTMQAVSAAMQSAVFRTDVDYSKLNPEDIPGAGADYADEATWNYVTGEKIALVKKLNELVPH